MKNSVYDRLLTKNSMHFLQLAHIPCTIVHLEPDGQPVLHTASHLVEELQALLLPLWVEQTGLQQGRLLGLPRGSVHMHVIPSV